MTIFGFLVNIEPKKLIKKENQGYHELGNRGRFAG